MAAADYYFTRVYNGDGSSLGAYIRAVYDDQTLLISRVEATNNEPGFTMTGTLTDAGTGKVVFTFSCTTGQTKTFNVPGNQHMVEGSPGVLEPPIDYHYLVTWAQT